jgi:hypothetical protein
MNFSQMHDRLRVELLRRIQRGTLSVSLLSRQTGFGQSHVSNFLHSRGSLSLAALDRVLAAQNIAVEDLIPLRTRNAAAADTCVPDLVPLVSHTAALFEPVVRPSAAQMMLHLPPGTLRSFRAKNSRGTAQLAAVCCNPNRPRRRSPDGSGPLSECDCSN